MAQGSSHSSSAPCRRASIAFVAAFYHLTNHSIYKALLFLGAGTVDYRAGTRDLEHLGGFIHRMPWTAPFFLVGALSIAAVCPFNGFASEWLTLQALLRSAEIESLIRRHSRTRRDEAESKLERARFRASLDSHDAARYSE